MKFKITLLVFSFLSIVSFSQEIPDEEDKTIKGQFDKIFRTSTTYKPAGTPKKYKVIDLNKYQILKSNVLDSIKKLEKLISEKENLLLKERNNVKNLNTNLSKTKVDLDTALEKENSISLFGKQLNKITYNLIVWILVLILLILLIYFIVKFSRSNSLTKEAKDNLFDVEQDFETHRKKSLEREQKLRRQLQDEINKQRS
ncbi:hypothetical protein [Polaribacter porphyrae]|uniref:tRNA (Guanine-N1)-methyltransferase n=1 Tax=Polaribacter porphyrae TaxID=1137780 RepID=A0A2S7WTC4_9FLAO|nr:hypothetical protein [Polaribacter porphyrae]PQJ80843.1 hypothetical protein BTO18_17425 [Polaribacter porphyrae]